MQYLDDVMYEPLIVRAASLGHAWAKAVTAMMTHGFNRFVDAPEYKCWTKDSPMFIIVEDPEAEPRMHPLTPTPRDMADDYARNVINGYPSESTENEFDYTYFSRLRCYPDCEVRASLPNRSSNESLPELVDKISGGKCVVQRIDQVKMAIENFRKDPTRRSVVMHTWIPARDLVKFGPKREKSSSPCLVTIHPQIVENKLHFFVTMKTNDLFNAFPLNAFGFVALQKHMAEEIGVGVGMYTHFSVSMQIYEDMYEMAREVVESELIKE